MYLLACIDDTVLIFLYMCVIPKQYVEKYVQACFDGAVAVNARGKGVQLPKAECFTHACRILWPGYGEVGASVVQAFSL